jgi:hypothetical protein
MLVADLIAAAALLMCGVLVLQVGWLGATGTVALVVIGLVLGGGARA